MLFFFFFQAEDGIRYKLVTGVQTCALPIFDPATGHVRHYTANEGALLGDVLAALQDRDGALWFSYGTGLVRLVPEPDLPPIPPPVLITGLRVAGDAQPISALGEAEVAPLQFNAAKNELQIDFVALG